MVQTDVSADALSEKSTEQFTDSCGCVFCDLGMKPLAGVSGGNFHPVPEKYQHQFGRVYVTCLNVDRSDAPASSDSE